MILLLNVVLSIWVLKNIAKLSLSSSITWAEMAIFPANQATHLSTHQGVVVQAHLACSKGLDRLWVESKQTKVWKQSILTYSFLNVYSVFEKSSKNINLTIITTKLKYTFDLNSLPLSSSPVSLRIFSNVQIYNTLEWLDKD